MAKPKKLSAVQRAKRLAKGQAAPYRSAAASIQEDINAGMSNADIAKKYSEGYTAAGGTAAGYAPAIAASSGNVGSLIGGIAAMLPGGTTDYGVTSMVAGAQDEAKSNSFLAGLFGQSAAIDVGSAAAMGISGAQGRAADRTDALSKEKRTVTMQGDVVAGDFLSQMTNLMGIRAARQNLALNKLKIEAQKLANEKAANGGSGSGSTTKTPDTSPLTSDEKKKAAWKKITDKGAVQSAYGLEGLIGGYQPANMGSSRPAPGLRY
jgi:hypothetical protein